jgi:hypothetical protein
VRDTAQAASSSASSALDGAGGMIVFAVDIQIL